ncbi:unnamed protein product [Caenorhabditis brenneri]
MPFPLLRLPHLAQFEVIKSMRFSEIFFLPQVSPKFIKLVGWALPKNSPSLEIYFIFRQNKFEAEIYSIGPEISAEVESTYRIGDEVLNTVDHGKIVSCEWVGSGSVEQNEESMRKLFKYFLELLNFPKSQLAFCDNVSEPFAMEMIRYARHKNLPLRSIDFCLEECSRESLEEVLTGCQPDEEFQIAIDFPKNLKYTAPPGGFRMKHLDASEGHWINLDDFLQCQKITAKSGFEHVTAEYLNGFFKNVKSMECKTETLELCSEKKWNFSVMVEGLSGRPIHVEQNVEARKFERNDGVMMVVFRWKDTLYMRPLTDCWHKFDNI